jgi:hypothetical protein
MPLLCQIVSSLHNWLHREATQHSTSIKKAFYEASFNIVYQLSVIQISKFLDEEKY